MMNKQTKILTGITTTGTPHLGNYVGAIRPAIRASLNQNVQSFYFLADYHALIKCDDPKRIHRSTLEIAATWLACGLNPDHVIFYRQSDIPEIPELTWLLTCVTGKGQLNRAHAYKAAVDKNQENNVDSDFDVTAGLFMYPVLMAADILVFQANQVPVGRDQIQHIEMARDIAQRFNHLYSDGKSLLTLPEVIIEENVATLPGLDGRKMSKSYNNTLPLFSDAKTMRQLIATIQTDSRLPNEPKETEGSALFQIYQAFASDQETADFAKAYQNGIAWGEAKTQLAHLIEREIAPMRERYLALIADPQKLEAILQTGAQKARCLAAPFLKTLREAVGLRSLATFQLDSKLNQTHSNNQHIENHLAIFKQYREKDGLFYFKLVNSQNEVLIQSVGFNNPKEAGSLIQSLKQNELKNATNDYKNNIDDLTLYFKNQLIELQNQNKIQSFENPMAFDQAFNALIKMHESK